MNQFATYCPEDNKLRLYVGRVPRPEYDALRADGWTSTPKQDCDFVATWTPRRAATAREYSEGEILDEDQSPEDRAADRAERFAGYREKRSAEAHGAADIYEAGPSAYGFQSQARADRAAAKLDRFAGYACDAWSKAEYWQRRTAGVISHALHVATPAVRMGRILTIEAEQRKHRAAMAEYDSTFKAWQRVAWMTDPEAQTKAATALANTSGAGWHYKHPRPELCTEYEREHGSSLWSMLTSEKAPITGAEAAALYLARKIDPETTAWQESTWMQWDRHFTLRLAYENQMIEAQGGRANQLELEPGGWIGNFQIRKVNKSPATGRPVSVQVAAPTRANFDRQGKPYGPENPRPLSLHTINIERLAVDTYSPPTAEDRAALLDTKKAEKAAAPKPAPCPLVNPTDDDAERLQAVWNEQDARPGEAPATVERMTQATYSANSGGAYSAVETAEVTGGGFRRRGAGSSDFEDFPAVAKVRRHGRRVIVITDKPQKRMPAGAWNDPRPAVLAEVISRAEELRTAARKDWLNKLTDEERALFDNARRVGIAYIQSLSQFGLTAKGEEALAKPAPQAPAAVAAPALAQAHFGF
jgi:hypothetical protein